MPPMGAAGWRYVRHGAKNEKNAEIFKKYLTNALPPAIIRKLSDAAN